MAENRAEILAGAAVLAVAIGFMGYAFGGKGLTAEAGTYPLKASFRSVEGITAGSDVRLAGVKVGTITDPNSFIKVIRGRGYQLIKPISLKNLAPSGKSLHAKSPG